MDTSKLDGFIKLIKDLLCFIFAQLKRIYAKVDAYLTKNKPDYDVNKPPMERPTVLGRWPIWLIILVAAFILSLAVSVGERQQSEIPYSEFLKNLKEDRVEKVIVTERYIIAAIPNLKSYVSFGITLSPYSMNLIRCCQLSKGMN